MKTAILLLMIIFPFSAFSQQIGIEEFASGFTSPVEIVNAKDSRLFVVQQNGIIRILQPDGSINAEHFLNISGKITNSGEMGLLGLAFHPQYAANGYFFVYYNNTTGNITVARYRVSTANPDLADPASELVLLNIPKPFANHNGGSIHFGPDGYLWISTGDGGSGGDPQNNAQNRNSLLGKILRIDVNSGNPYSIPAGNPFVDGDGADEIWAYGLRNAWKFSFDTTSGNVWIADVGQNAFEEINSVPASQGGENYGWRCYEGNTAYNTAGCASSATMTFPVAVYNHSNSRCSVTGGYVYRGNSFAALQGRYIFTDYCTPQIGILTDNQEILWLDVFTGNNFSTFGEDVNKELYVAAINTGKIFRIINAGLGTDENAVKKYIIYPNPAENEIEIKGINDYFNLEIYSAEGKLVKSGYIDSRQKTDVSDLPAGTYFVTASQDGAKLFSRKLIRK